MIRKRGESGGKTGHRKAAATGIWARWLAVLALIVCFVFLQRGLWFTTSGLIHGEHLATEVTQQRKANSALAQSNAKRWEEVKDLKHGEGAIEEHARMDLGLVKKGETFYQIVKVPPKQSAAAANSGPTTASAPRPATAAGGGM